MAVREFPLKTGHGYADYLLYVDGQAVGVIEAKKKGETLTGVEVQHFLGILNDQVERNEGRDLYHSSAATTHADGGCSRMPIMITIPDD